MTDDITGRYRALIARDEAATAYEALLTASKAREQWLAEQLAAHLARWWRIADGSGEANPEHWLKRAQEETG